MTFYLGNKSCKELVSVHPDLVKVVYRAIKISPVDFAVHDGLRTIEEQREYVKRGVSWTMKSRHLKQSDGYGHAVDLVPYINGRLRWEWAPIYEITKAVRQAAQERRVKIVWGGCWKRIDNDDKDPETLVEEYGARRRAQGRKSNPDGPHFQLWR